MSGERKSIATIDRGVSSKKKAGSGSPLFCVIFHKINQNGIRMSYTCWP